MKLVKLAWGVLLGVKDMLVLCFMLIFFGVLYMAMSADPNPANGKGGALLLAFDGPIVDQKTEIDARSFLLGDGSVGVQYQLDEVLHALDVAATDDEIKTVVLDLDRFGGAGRVALQNIGERLDKIKAAKKPVLAFATGYFDASYTLAAHASEIWLDPMGAAAIAGPGGRQPYFKGLIDRFGVNVHVYRVGKYKSFVEPFTLTQQSADAKAADQALVDVIWDDWQAHVAKARPKAQLAAFIKDPLAGTSGTTMTMAEASLKAGMVDKIGDYMAFTMRVAALAGEDADAPAGFRASGIADYIAANPPGKGGDAVGIIHVNGTIVDGEAPGGSAGGDTVSALIGEGLAKKNLKALVLRVDSPGGSALASEKIRLALMEVKNSGLPVIVSMGNVAASGGYWVAMAGDKIFAEPSTITGSIGVFAVIPSFENTAGRYGVTTDGVKTTPLSGQPDILGGFSAETDRFLQTGVESTYARFLQLVATSRKLPLEKVAEIAQGRVWDGGTARQLGLVDAFGSLDDAVAEAAKRAKIAPDNVRRVILTPKETYLSELLGSWGTAKIARVDVMTRMVRQQQAAFVAGLSDAASVITGPAVQARCLSCPPVVVNATSASLFTQLKNRFFND
ncbi:MAG: signal peptide peptidase SppA [Pseudomonadota bacterium]